MDLIFWGIQAKPQLSKHAELLDSMEALLSVASSY